MKNDTVTDPIGHLPDVDDPLTEVLRSGARRLLVQAHMRRGDVKRFVPEGESAL